MTNPSSRPALGAVLALALAVFAAAPAAAQEAEPAASFTAAQVETGRVAYGRNCARCHLDDLSGGDAAPLVGGYFVGGWGGKPAFQLLDFVRDLMPMDGPGSLDAATYAAVVAYLLSANGMTAGDAPLAEGATGLIRPAPAGN